MNDKEIKEVVYGKNPVEGLLLDNPNRVSKVYIAKGVKFDSKIRNIVARAKENGIAVIDIPREKMDSLASGVNQGVAASVSPVEYAQLSDLTEKTKDKNNALIILLDKVEDPHNLGSIIRTAAAAGADGIIIPKRRSSPITSVVEKASAGTVQKVPIAQVNNLSSAIEELKKKNFWSIGAESGNGSYYFEQKYNMKCALVLGGENQGISTLVKKNCDILVRIPMSEGVNSLNVANAASILIYEIVRQRFIK